MKLIITSGAVIAGSITMKYFGYKTDEYIALLFVIFALYIVWKYVEYTNGEINSGDYIPDRIENSAFSKRITQTTKMLPLNDNIIEGELS